MARQLTIVDNVEVGADPGFERLWHRTQRVVWTNFCLLVALGLTGLFGRGPLAHAAAGSPQDPIGIEYDRFARFQSPGTLKIFVKGGAIRNGQLVLDISQDLVETLQLNRTSPPPSSVQAVNDGQRFTFSAAGDLAKSTITFVQNPNKFGRIKGRIGAAGASHIAVEQIVYP